MKIIRIIPQAADSAKEKVIRVLTFDNGSYALHSVDDRGQSHLALYDWQGSLIKKGIRAESAYIFKNGNYILLYEPAYSLPGLGNTHFRRRYRLFARGGGLVLDDIASFVPLADDWVILLRSGVKILYDDKFNKIDSSTHYDFVKFDGGYARVAPRETLNLCSSESIGKHLPGNPRFKTVSRDISGKKDDLVYDWELFNEQGEKMYSVNNGVAVFGGGYVLTLTNSGKFNFYYPSGERGSETTLNSGARKNIACLVCVCHVPVPGYPDQYRVKTTTIYRLSRETKDNVPLAYLVRGISDVHEFANGNFSCVNDDALCFFKENTVEPMLKFPLDKDVRFLPDGRYWDISERTLCSQTGEVLLEDVDAVAELDDWYVAIRKGVLKVYNSDGKKIAENVGFVRKTNGITALRLENGKIALMHRSGKLVVPPLDEGRCFFEECAF